MRYQKIIFIAFSMLLLCDYVTSSFALAHLAHGLTLSPVASLAANSLHPLVRHKRTIFFKKRVLGAGLIGLGIGYGLGRFHGFKYGSKFGHQYRSIHRPVYIRKPYYAYKPIYYVLHPFAKHKYHDYDYF